MKKQTHEVLLQTAINEMTKQGFRVVRLDKREIPDAIAFKDKQVIAIEAETNPYSNNSICKTIKKYETCIPQYDSELVVSNDNGYRGHTKEEYLRVIKLREEGKTYTEIQTTFKSEFKKGICRSLINGWVKGKKRPPCLRW